MATSQVVDEPRLSQPRDICRSAYSRPALWATLFTAIGVTAGSLGPFNFRMTYGRFLNRHFHLLGIWDVTAHTLMHLLSFGLLGFLASLISLRWPFRVSAISAVLLLALAIEYVQYWSHHGNPFEIWDVRSDFLGACLGALLAYAWSAARGLV